MAKKTVSPSKKRYDEAHPGITFRVPKEEKDRLISLLAKEKKSIGQFFREALGNEENHYKEAFNRGYRKGFDEAKSRYAVAPLCVSCMEPIFIDDVELQEAMAEDLPFTCLHEGCSIPPGVEKENIRLFKIK